MPRRRLKTTVFFPPQTQTQQQSLSSRAHNTLEDVFVNTVRHTRSDNYNIDSITKTTTARVGSTSIALRRDVSPSNYYRQQSALLDPLSTVMDNAEAVDQLLGSSIAAELVTFHHESPRVRRFTYFLKIHLISFLRF